MLYTILHALSFNDMNPNPNTHLSLTVPLSLKAQKNSKQYTAQVLSWSLGPSLYAVLYVMFCMKCYWTL